MSPRRFFYFLFSIENYELENSSNSTAPLNQDLISSSLFGDTCHKIKDSFGGKFLGRSSSEQLVIVGYKLVRIKYHHLHVKLCSLSIEIVILS